MTLNPRLFRKVMGTFATGVTVVTTLDPSGLPYGVTVNSFTSVSLDPPLVLVCLDNGLSGLGSFLASARFGVHVLSAPQREVSNHFASRGSDRSVGLDSTRPDIPPVVPGALARLECRLAQTYTAGDHTILLGEVESVQISPDADHQGPLLYYRGRYRDLPPE